MFVVLYSSFPKKRWCVHVQLLSEQFLRGRWKNPSITSRSMFDDIYVESSISTLFAVNIWIRAKYSKLNFKEIFFCWEANILKTKERKEYHEPVEKLAVLASDGASKIEGFGRLVATTVNGCKSKTWTKHSSSSQSSFSSSPIMTAVIISTILTTTSAYKSKNWSLQRSYSSSSQQWRWWSSVYVYVQHQNHQPRYLAHHNSTTGTSIVQQMTKPIHPNVTLTSFFLPLTHLHPNSNIVGTFMLQPLLSSLDWNPKYLKCIFYTWLYTCLHLTKMFISKKQIQISRNLLDAHVSRRHRARKYWNSNRSQSVSIGPPPTNALLVITLNSTTKLHCIAEKNVNVHREKQCALQCIEWQGN